MKLWLKVCYLLAPLFYLLFLFGPFIMHVLFGGSKPSSLFNGNPEEYFMLFHLLLFLIFGLGNFKENKLTNIALFITSVVIIFVIGVIVLAQINPDPAAYSLLLIAIAVPLEFISFILILIGLIYATVHKIKNRNLIQ